MIFNECVRNILLEATIMSLKAPTIDCLRTKNQTYKFGLCDSGILAIYDSAFDIRCIIVQN